MITKTDWYTIIVVVGSIFKQAVNVIGQLPKSLVIHQISSIYLSSPFLQPMYGTHWVAQRTLFVLRESDRMYWCN